MIDEQKAGRLLSAGTAVISDVFDLIGKVPLALDPALFPLLGPGKGFAGPAYTITGETRRWSDGGGDIKKLQAIDDMPPGVVPVWAGGDIRGVCCFGDLLAEAMKSRGCAGVVVDGGVRDTAYLAQLGLPVMARYRTPCQAIGRWRVTEIQKRALVRGALESWIAVNPGDLIVVDDDGVMVIPGDLVDEFLERTSNWADKDQQARDDIRKGTPLLAALKKFGHL
ncbi:MAG: RraA family protein [Pseudomonadota bacterium]